MCRFRTHSVLKPACYSPTLTTPISGSDGPSTVRDAGMAVSTTAHITIPVVRMSYNDRFPFTPSRVDNIIGGKTFEESPVKNLNG